MPIKELKSFKRISLAKGSEGSVTLKIPVQDLQKWDMATHQWKIYSGKYKLLLGSNSADEKASVDFTITK